MFDSATGQSALFDATLNGPLQLQRRQSTVNLETSCTPRLPAVGRGDSRSPYLEDAATAASAALHRQRSTSSRGFSFAERSATGDSPAASGESDRAVPIDRRLELETERLLSMISSSVSLALDIDKEFENALYVKTFDI